MRIKIIYKLILKQSNKLEIINTKYNIQTLTMYLFRKFHCFKFVIISKTFSVATEMLQNHQS